MEKIFFHHSTTQVEEIRVTIPEGYRVSQIDALLANKELIQPGDLNKIASLDEGYLFPDTYTFLKTVTAEEIRQTMRDNFTKRTSDLHLTKNDLILASIVEREAKFDEDRAKIAGVYLARLNIGMPLQSDPTVQYGKGSWAAITTADYKNVISFYNTYLHTGLPIGPICNPGLKSIEASLHPVETSDLYFMTDSKGHARFYKTLQERNADLSNL